GFQAFDGTDLVTQTDVRSWRDAEVELDDIPEHPGGEPRQANAPYASGLLEQPIVSRRITSVAGQMRREPRATIVHALIARNAHGVAILRSRYGSTAATSALQSGSGVVAHHENLRAPSILQSGSRIAVST